MGRIEILKTGIIRKKALINIESNGQNLIFYKQWSRHTTEYIDYYSNLFKALKQSLIKGLEDEQWETLLRQLCYCWIKKDFLVGQKKIKHFI